MNDWVRLKVKPKQKKDVSVPGSFLRVLILFTRVKKKIGLPHHEKLFEISM
jgi:hypothetical protein